MGPNIRQLLFSANIAMLSAQSPGTFTATGSMVTARVFHTATLLIDSRVLITGGSHSARGGGVARGIIRSCQSRPSDSPCTKWARSRFIPANVLIEGPAVAPRKAVFFFRSKLILL
jgi:hypothetical protein